MDFKDLRGNFSRELEQDFLYVGLSIVIVLGVMVGHNAVTTSEPTRVGYTEIGVKCHGIDAGFCIGLEKNTYETFGYDNYTDPELGTANYYRRIESELMIQAYNTCSSEMEGYEWTSKVSYANKTAEEWRQNENIQLLPCEESFYRNLSDSS